jgi:hypothetical protein
LEFKCKPWWNFTFPDAKLLSSTNTPQTLLCFLLNISKSLRNQGEVNSSMDGRGISTRGVKPPEDIGDEYFKDLLWMVFFQDAEKYDDGNMNCYKMHDIIRYLARYVSGEEFMIVEHDLLPFGLVQTCHSCSVGKVGSFTVPEALYEAEQLRTLLLVGVEGLKDIPFKLFSSFKYSRVLDLNSCGLASLD